MGKEVIPVCLQALPLTLIPTTTSTTSTIILMALLCCTVPVPLQNIQGKCDCRQQNQLQLAVIFSAQSSFIVPLEDSSHHRLLLACRVFIAPDNRSQCKIRNISMHLHCLDFHLATLWVLAAVRVMAGNL